MNPPLPNVREHDVDSPASLIAASYEILSGAARAPRDWDRFRTLYWPGARLMPARVDADGVVIMDCFDVESYIASRTPMLAAADFYEAEVMRSESRHGHLAHVLSHYESRRAPDAAPFSVGINSIQLFFDARRWWFLSVAWDSGTNGVAPPASKPAAFTKMRLLP